MDFNEEFQRISKVIDEMPMEEFENMLSDCGVGEIRPSEQSDYVRAVVHAMMQ